MDEFQQWNSWECCHEVPTSKRNSQGGDERKTSMCRSGLGPTGIKGLYLFIFYIDSEDQSKVQLQVLNLKSLAEVRISEYQISDAVVDLDLSLF